MRFSLLLFLLVLFTVAACQGKRLQPTTAPLAEVAAAAPEPERVRGDEPVLRAPPTFQDSSAEGARSLQGAEQAMHDFPVDRYGFVDWAATLKKGLIAPRNALQDGGEVRPLDLDVLMRNTREMPYVVFPHRAHTEWLACGNCHPALFAEKAGSTRIAMDDIFRGEHCGVCHGKVAFPTYYTCERCHSVPHGEGKAWWK